MSQGIPFVTTSTGAEGITGIEKIVPVMDDAKDIANKIIELYDNNEELSKISLEERKFISKNFNTESAWKIIEKDFEARYNTIVIAPDGFGSKGDEAVIEGALKLISPLSVKIINPREDLWINHNNYVYLKCNEVQCELSEFKNAIEKETKLFVLGTDILDGTHEKEIALARLEAAKKMADLGGKSYVFCSFRSDADQDVVRYIRKMPENVKFYLRDEISYKNFVNLTRRKCYYYPDLAFFTKPIKNANTEKETNNLKKLKEDYNLIGLNFCESSFRSLFKKHDDETRKKYIKDVIKIIIDTVDNPYIVFICHDTRGWDGYRSDAEFSNLGVEVCEDLDFKNVMVLDETYNHNEISMIVKELDVVITGRMHLSIASIKAGVFPITYTGSGEQDFSMNDKFHGMFIDRFNNDDYVTHNLDELKSALEKVFNNYYECSKELEYSEKVLKKDIEYFESFKEELLKENKNDNNKDTI